MIKSEIFNTLKNKGFRLTPVRKGIIAFIALANRPVDEEMIKQNLDTQKISFNRTTIYRELQFLIDESIIKQILFPDGVKRYELLQNEHHHHVICKKCKKIEPIYLEEAFLTTEIANKSPKGFIILGHHLEFSGLCNKCK